MVAVPLLHLPSLLLLSRVHQPLVVVTTKVVQFWVALKYKHQAIKKKVSLVWVIILQNLCWEILDTLDLTLVAITPITGHAVYHADTTKPSHKFPLRHNSMHINSQLTSDSKEMLMFCAIIYRSEHCYR